MHESNRENPTAYRSIANARTAASRKIFLNIGYLLDGGSVASGHYAMRHG
jgi:hypothetical protein